MERSKHTERDYHHYEKVSSHEDLNKFFQLVYFWMFLGLLISAGVSYFVSTSKTMLSLIFGNVVILIILIVLQLLMVFVIGLLINHISADVAKIMFFIYSALTGLTFSVIFIVYELGSIFFVFIVTSLIFLLMSLFGRYTDKDLTSLGTILMVGLIVIIIASIINIFLRNPMLYLIITIIAVIIFTGLIAYDTQKIKEWKIKLEQINHIKYEKDKEELEKKIAVIGALILYLDFINLFINLLKLLGKRRE
ncbi:MAG: Bax inhibitor-1/YccA family protein [Candidatus Woesearchaeota archaeon]